MDIKGKAKVFCKEIDGRNGPFTVYSIGIGSKQDNGEWINAFIPCRFRKGVMIPNGTMIEVLNGFLTVQKGREYNKPMVMVLDFQTVEETEEWTF